MGTQPKTKMEQQEKGNIINYENMLVHSVQIKHTQIHALWAYNNMNLEKIPSHSTFSQLHSELPFIVPEMFLNRPQRENG